LSATIPIDQCAVAGLYELLDGSHALSGNPGQDALRPLCRDAERLGLHAHADGSTPRRGNDQRFASQHPGGVSTRMLLFKPFLGKC